MSVVCENGVPTIVVFSGLSATWNWYADDCSGRARWIFHTEEPRNLLERVIQRPRLSRVFGHSGASAAPSVSRRLLLLHLANTIPSGPRSRCTCCAAGDHYFRSPFTSPNCQRVHVYCWQSGHFLACNVSAFILQLKKNGTRDTSEFQ